MKDTLETHDGPVFDYDYAPFDEDDLGLLSEAVGKPPVTKARAGKLIAELNKPCGTWLLLRRIKARPTLPQQIKGYRQVEAYPDRYMPKPLPAEPTEGDEPSEPPEPVWVPFDMAYIKKRRRLNVSLDDDPDFPADPTADDDGPTRWSIGQLLPSLESALADPHCPDAKQFWSVPEDLPNRASVIEVVREHRKGLQKALEKALAAKKKHARDLKAGLATEDEAPPPTNDVEWLREVILTADDETPPPKTANEWLFRQWVPTYEKMYPRGLGRSNSTSSGAGGPAVRWYRAAFRRTLGDNLPSAERVSSWVTECKKARNRVSSQ